MNNLFNKLQKGCNKFESCQEPEVCFNCGRKKEEHPLVFPTKADYMYYIIRLHEKRPKWAKIYGKPPLVTDIHDVINSHIPKDERDKHYAVKNLMIALKYEHIIKAGKLNKLKEWAQYINNKENNKENNSTKQQVFGL